MDFMDWVVIGTWLACFPFVVHAVMVHSSERYRRWWWRDRCPNCNFPFSDWFVWPPGGRYCYLCHTYPEWISGLDESWGIGLRLSPWEKDPHALPKYFAYGEHPNEIKKAEGL